MNEYAAQLAGNWLVWVSILHLGNALFLGLDAWRTARRSKVGGYSIRLVRRHLNGRYRQNFILYCVKIFSNSYAG